METLNIAGTVFVQPWLWFTTLLESVDMTGVFLSALSMFLAFKFLIAPFIGSSGGSDTVRKRKKGG